MSLALIVKPALWTRPRARTVLDDLVSGGAEVLSGGDIPTLRQQAAALEPDVRIVAVGGDGTVHLAANAVAGTERLLAIVPMGTGNDIASHFGLRRATDRSVRSDHVVDIDLGEIQCADGTQRYFMGVASCGFDAQVNERANRMRGPQGAAKYLAAVIAEVGALTPRQVTVRDEVGERAESVTLIALGNTTRYGGGMRVCPTADPQDGRLTVTSVAPVSRRTLLTVLPRVFTGSHVHHPAVSVSHTSFMVIGGEPFPVYADGERVGLGPVDVRIAPRALRLLVPA